MTLAALLLPGGVGYTKMTADTVAAALEERGGRETGSRQAGEDGGGRGGRGDGGGGRRGAEGEMMVSGEWVCQCLCVCYSRFLLFTMSCRLYSSLCVFVCLKHLHGSYYVYILCVCAVFRCMQLV